MVVCPNQDLMCFREKQHLMVLLIRHGQPGSPEGRRVAPEGFLGDPLTALGLRQARRLAARLEQLPLDHIYCSDMARSYQTASAVSSLQPHVSMEILSDLREIPPFHFPKDAPAQTPEQRRTFREHCRAATRFVGRLRNRHAPGRIIAIVTHRQINQLLIATMAGLPMRQWPWSAQYHTAVSVVNLVPDGQARLMMVNCRRHLTASMMTDV